MQTLTAPARAASGQVRRRFCTQKAGENSKPPYAALQCPPVEQYGTAPQADARFQTGCLRETPETHRGRLPASQHPAGSRCRPRPVSAVSSAVSRYGPGPRPVNPRGWRPLCPSAPRPPAPGEEGPPQAGVGMPLGTPVLPQRVAGGRSLSPGSVQQAWTPPLLAPGGRARSGESSLQTPRPTPPPQPPRVPLSGRGCPSLTPSSPTPAPAPQRPDAAASRPHLAGT